MNQNEHPMSNAKRNAALAVIVLSVIIIILVLLTVFLREKGSSVADKRDRNNPVKSANQRETGSRSDRDFQSGSANLETESQSGVVNKQNNQNGSQKNEVVDTVIKTSVISFNEKEKSLSKNEKFVLEVMIDPVDKNISAVDLHLDFDAKKLKLEEIVPGNSFSTVLYPAKIDNEGGTAAIALGVPLAQPAVNKQSAVVTLKFQALSETGTATVNLSDKTMAAAVNETQNVIATRESAKVIIY